MNNIHNARVFCKTHIVILIWPRAQIFPGLTPGPEFKWAGHKWRVDVFLSGATNRGLSYLCGVTEAGFGLFYAGWRIGVWVICVGSCYVKYIHFFVIQSLLVNCRKYPLKLLFRIFDSQNKKWRPFNSQAVRGASVCGVWVLGRGESGGAINICPGWRSGVWVFLAGPQPRGMTLFWRGQKWRGQMSVTMTVCF